MSVFFKGTDSQVELTIQWQHLLRHRCSSCFLHLYLMKMKLHLLHLTDSILLKSSLGPFQALE